MGLDPAFCCNGCALAYETLHRAGLAGPYYRLRDLAPPATLVAARGTLDPLLLSELDHPAFLEQHTRAERDGTRRATLFLEGVHCAACVWLVERMPFEQPGVQEARLDLPRARLDLRFDPRQVRLSDVARWLAAVGYGVHPTREGSTAQRAQGERRLLIKLGVSWALAGNVMLLAFAFYAGLDAAEEPGLAAAARWASLALALPAVLYGGSTFFRRAWASLRVAVRTRSVRALHMDTPISLGILVGFLDSTRATITGQGELWFDSITVLIAALLTARWLQHRSHRLAGEATERLLALIPSMARRVAPDQTVTPVRSADLRPGDVVEVLPGEVIPVDGLVTDGCSDINNAVLTGESRPERVQPGAAVGAGATNLTTPVRVEVRASGDQTRVGRLLAWVRDGDARRAPVLLLADRLSGWFTLAVLTLAGVTAVIWWLLDPTLATRQVVALLVITCPCALGMATPLALAVATGKAARHGLYIKSEAALQQLAALDTLVLDKTGTLTQGRMALVEAVGPAYALELAAALETKSTHPLATALVQPYEARLLATHQVSEVEVFTGTGIRGRVDGNAVAVGRPDWILELSPAGDNVAGVDPLLGASLQRFLADGLTPVLVAVEGQPVAVLAFGDLLRPDARQVLARWQQEGRSLHLLSGDHLAVVQAVARALNLPPDQVRGGVGPEEKAAYVRQLQADGHVVAMAGDGVNDAAALQQADVGIAVHGGSTASLIAADVFLTREGLTPIAGLLGRAHRTMRVIRRNLGFSLAYNVFGAALAMSGLVDPLVAAIAMPLSSLTVVLSSIAQHDVFDLQ